VRYTFKEHTSWIDSVALSTDGKLLASGSMHETVQSWDLVKGQRLCILKEEGDSSCIRSGTWSPDGSLVASGSTDQVVRL
jgi:WD40 repeat protein